jgi:hypothetical protein
MLPLLVVIGDLVGIFGGWVISHFALALPSKQYWATAWQALDGRERVKRAEEQMRMEMAKDDGPVVIQRRALEGCIEDSLSRIRASVEPGDSRTAVLDAVARFDIPRHTWDSVAYQAANAAGV